MSLIFKRKSVRKYSDESVPDEKIENLLKAAMQAPSAKFATPAREASHLIITLGNLNESKVHGMIEQDLGACNENILLQATHEGLGAVWLGFHPIEDRTLKLKEYLNIPDYCIPFSVICVGWPERDGEVKLRYDKSKVHFDRF